MNDCPRSDLAPGYSIATIINGCWQLTPDHGGGPVSEKRTLRPFSELLDYGFTTFDCADIYTGVEELLGRFRRSLADPDSIQIHTKYAPDRDELQYLDKRKIDSAVDRSLQQLGVECIDLLQFHWWDYDTPGIDAVTDQLVRAQKAGKIRLLGLTNFNTSQVRQIVAGGAQIATLQTQYSLLDRRPEKHMSDLSAPSNIHLLPYGVLGGGFLSHEYLGAEPPQRMNRSLQKYRLVIEDIGGWQILQQLLEMLAGIAAKHDTTIAAIAARWVLDQPGVAAIILGTGNRSRATEKLALSQLQLDDEDREKISAHIGTQIIPDGDMYDLERDAGGPHTKILRMNLNEAVKQGG